MSAEELRETAVDLREWAERAEAEGKHDTATLFREGARDADARAERREREIARAEGLS